MHPAYVCACVWPPQAVGGAEVERSTQLSCGEHTDYGLLTLVNQESHMAALQVCTH